MSRGTGVSLGPVDGGAAHGISVKHAVTLPGLDDAPKHLLVETAPKVCPYSNATRGNIDVDLTVV